MARYRARDKHLQEPKMVHFLGAYSVSWIQFVDGAYIDTQIMYIRNAVSYAQFAHVFPVEAFGAISQRAHDAITTS